MGKLFKRVIMGILLLSAIYTIPSHGDLSINLEKTGLASPELQLPEMGYITNTTSIVFTWNTVTSATEYQIQTSTNSDFTSIFHDTNTSSTSPSLRNFRYSTYYWRVRAFDGLVYGPWSETRMLLTTSDKQVAPYIISPSNASTSLKQLINHKWAKVSYASWYNFEIYNASDNSALTDQISLTTTSYQWNYESGNYYWRVRATELVNGSEVNYPWTENYTITVNILNPPTLISPMSGTYTNETTPTLTWSTTDADLVKLRVGLTPDRTNLLIIDKFLSAQNTQFTTNLTDGTYYWDMLSMNNDGNMSDPSPLWNFTIDTQAPFPIILETPSDNSIIFNNSVTLTWNDYNLDTVSYDVQIFTVSNGVTQIVESAKVSTTNYTTSPLDDGTYSWYVRGRDAAGNLGIIGRVNHFEVLTTTQNVGLTNVTTTTTETSISIEVSTSVSTATIQQTVTTSTTPFPMLATGMMLAVFIILKKREKY